MLETLEIRERKYPFTWGDKELLMSPSKGNPPPRPSTELKNKQTKKKCWNGHIIYGREWKKVVFEPWLIRQRTSHIHPFFSFLLFNKNKLERGGGTRAPVAGDFYRPSISPLLAEFLFFIIYSTRCVYYSHPHTHTHTHTPMDFMCLSVPPHCVRLAVWVSIDKETRDPRFILGK